MFRSLKPRRLWLLIPWLAVLAAIAAVACGGETETITVVETVVVKEQVPVPGERVVETVVVEKVVEGKTVTEIQTVVVERPVTVTEKVIETVVVEKIVEGKTVTEIQTVVVERPVTVTEKVVETVVVEKIVAGKTVTEIQTVVVERPVTVKVVETVIVPRVETIVVTPTPTQDEIAMAEKEAGTLRIASVGSVQSFDPLWTTASGTANVSSTILEGLLAYNEDSSTGKLLLDSWTTSDDGLTWTFTIRDGVTFHDGTPLTTAEVVGTLNRQKDRGTILKLVWKDFGEEAFEDFVQVVDDSTFTLNFRERTGLALDAIGPQGFAPLIVTESWHKLPATNSAPGQPIGTGPYRFESWSPGDRWSGVRYDDYSPSPDPTNGEAGRHEAFFDRFEYIEISDQTTRVAALQTGEVDLVQEFSQDLLPRLTNDPNIQIIGSPPFRLMGEFNYQIPPWNDPVHGRSLRQAVVMAYDNEKALLAAAGTQDRINLCPSLTQCGTVWETSAGSENRYNAKRVEDARKIVADSGYAGYTIRVMDPVDRQPAHGAAQVTKEVLEDIGFKVDLRVMDWATMVQDRATVDRWELFHTWSSSALRIGPIGHLRSGDLIYKGWFNQYTDVDGTQRRLFGEMARETDPARIVELMDEFQEYFYLDAIFLTIGEFFNNWAARNDLRGVHGGPGGQKPYDKFITR